MTPEPQPGNPEKFDGNTHACREFLDQLDIHFHIHQEHYTSDESKVLYLLSLLKGPALQWASTIVRNKDSILQDYIAFISTLSSLFGEPERERNAERSLSNLKQGRDTAVEYAAKFQSIARDVPWNERALIHQFVVGLSELVQNEVATKDLPSSLQDAIILAVRIDNRILERTRYQAFEKPNTRYPALNYNKSSFPTYDNTLKSSSSTLSKEERRQDRAASGDCFYCGKPGHSIGNCMTRLRAQQLKEGAQSQH